MNLLEGLNQSLAYIEEHLTEEIDFKEAARYAACSEYHFKRMFSFLAGLSLSEYIRRRRLTLAAFDLQNTKLRIIDAAVKYGYQSPDAFTKAFHSFHGVTPSEARDNDQSLKVYPRLYFQLTIRGGKEMIYRIVEKEAFRIVGIMKRVPIQFHGVNPEIAAMWKNMDEASIALMKSLSNGTPSGIISASTNFSEDRMEEKGELDHYIGVATTLENPAPFVKLEVPAMTWAVFEVIGPFPAALQEIWGRVYSEWFPASPYEQVEGPEMLWNESKEVSSPAFRSEIWIPVKRKPSL